MFCDYELSNYRGDYTAEDNNHGKWSIKSAKSTPQEITLEDEIHMLRRKMEQIFGRAVLHVGDCHRDQQLAGLED